MKKKVLGTLLGLTLVIGGTQVYASSVLNTNIIDLIRNAILGHSQTAEADLTKKLDTSKEDVKKAVSTIVSEKEADVQNRINQYKDQEIANANSEIASFVNEVEQEIDAFISEEEAKAKQKITEKKDKKVKEFKDELLLEIEKLIE